MRDAIFEIFRRGHAEAETAIEALQVRLRGNRDNGARRELAAGGNRLPHHALAKPLAGGLPMGAVLLTEAVAASLQPGLHATTFGGGPLVASVGARVVAEIARPEFLAAVRAKAEALRERLAALALPCVAEVRGQGLLIGVRLDLPGHENPAAEVVKAALAQRLLVVQARTDVVRLIPPLTVTDAELDEAVELLGRALTQVRDA